MDALEQRIEDIYKITQDIKASLSERAKNDRLIIMIDRSNFDQTWRRAEVEKRPDYVKLQRYLVGNRTLRQVRLYYSDLDSENVPEHERVEYQRRQEFYNFLRHQGWLLRKARKKYHGGVSVEKGLDADLVMDMDRLARENRCDTIVLVSGDSDYCGIVEKVQSEYATRVEVAFFPQFTARELTFKASTFTNLDCVRDQLAREV